MRTVTYRLADLNRAVIPLGFVGENQHTRILFDAKKVFDDYPAAVPSMTVQPPQGTSYPAVVVRDGDIVTWDVSDSDLIHAGTGELQLAFIENEVKVRTFIARTRIDRSIVPTGEIPEPLEDFLEEASAAVAAIPQEVADGVAEGFGAITAAAETLTPGSSATADFDSENKVLTIGVPEGERGQTGPAGADGAPGKDGKDGKDGTDGVDGFSPTATVTKSGKTVTIAITDKNGTTTATVSDGEDADPTELIDDTTTTATNKVWSAKKTADEVSNLNNAITQTQDEIGTVPTGKTVQGQITDINSEISKIDGELTYTFDNLEIGSINSSGADTSGSSRIRTIGYIDIDSFAYCTMTNQTTYELFLFVYGADKSFIERYPTNWGKVDLTHDSIVTAYPTAKYIRIAFRKPDNMTLFNSDVTVLKTYIHLNSIYKTQTDYIDMLKARYDGKFCVVAYSNIKNDPAPINSKEHFIECAKRSYDGIKGDIAITSDNYLIMCHDSGYTFDGSSKITTYDSSNATSIRSLTYAQVKELTFAQQYNGQDVHPADIDDFLYVAKKYGKIPYITVRDSYMSDIVPVLLAKLQFYELTTECCACR